MYFCAFQRSVEEVAGVVTVSGAWKSWKPLKLNNCSYKSKSSCVTGAGVGASAKKGGGRDGVGVTTWPFAVSEISVGSVMYWGNLILQRKKYESMLQSLEYKIMYKPDAVIKILTV